MFIIFLKNYHKILPGLDIYSFNFPEYYLAGALVSIIIGLSFFKLFWNKIFWRNKKKIRSS